MFLKLEPTKDFLISEKKSGSYHGWDESASSLFPALIPQLS